MTIESHHNDLMEAKGFWNQFVTAFYFERPKDTIAGHLIAHETEGPPKDPIPKLYLQTEQGARRYVMATQERLKAALQAACPARGDWLRITYVGDGERAAPGMTKAKLFEVELKRRQTTPRAAAS